MIPKLLFNLGRAERCVRKSHDFVEIDKCGLGQDGRGVYTPPYSWRLDLRFSELDENITIATADKLMAIVRKYCGKTVKEKRDIYEVIGKGWWCILELTTRSKQKITVRISILKVSV